MKIFILLIIFTFFFGCVSRSSGNYPCDKVLEIKELPFKDESKDPVYKEIIESGNKCLPYLIEKIDDLTKINDPEGKILKIPNIRSIVLGDICFFIALDITKYRPEDFLDKKSKKAFETRGIYAYFDYVEDLANRKKIKEKFAQLIDSKTVE